MRSHSAELDSTLAKTSGDADQIEWIERKELDLVRLAELLETSGRANRWTNFGPCARRLEQEVSGVLGLDDRSAVVATSSGTSALNLLAAQAALESGRPLRWVASSLSFPNVGSGLTADVEFIDCDATGLLDVAALSALDPDSFDGVIVTNPFGCWLDPAYLDAVIRHARGRPRHRPVIVDNAAGMGFGWDSGVPVAYSLHHTKPFGFGEGGAVVVSKEHEPAVRSLINFGLQPGSRVRKRPQDQWAATNGKLSELSSAAIVARFESRRRWEPLYREQGQRVTVLARRAGLALLPGFDPMRQTTNAVPIMGSRPIGIDEILSSVIGLERPHPPIGPGATAALLSSHLVFVPSHSGIARLSDRELLIVLESLAAAIG